MAVNQEVKGTLAKLLATENLNVEHRAVSTAYFDVSNRVLCLPIWKDVSGTVYDLLVGHEVGHALYTPLNYGEVSQEVPQDILNVLEDVRVEKLMKRRYPGLSKSFYNGYNELDQKDFFELQGKDISKMSFIDRINIHYKIGVVGNRTIVAFEREEYEFVNLAAETETFDDVVNLSKEIMKYLKSKKDDKEELANFQSKIENGSDENDSEKDEKVGPSSSDAKQQDQSNGGSDFKPVDQDGLPQGGGSTTSIGGNNQPVDEFASETARALADNQKSLVDSQAKDYVYINLPQINLSNTIVPYKKITNDFNQFVSGIVEKRPKNVETSVRKYRTYRKDSIKTVNYLVKEFECKKAADQYHRSSTANTGVLDTQKLHTYQWSEDIFKKVTTIPDGKNHGLVFYLDWSGSMGNIMLATLKQLYDLIWFCKKVNIPFRVYAFSDSCYNTSLFPGTPNNNLDLDLHIDPNFRLLEFFSSKMNAQTLDKMMENMFFNCDQFRGGNGDYNYDYSLSGTPLVETIVTTPQVIEKFKSEEKIQKVNVIYLTDGESSNACYNKYIPYLDSSHSQPMYYNQTYVLRDPKTKYQCQIKEDGNTTAVFAEYVSHIVDYNLLGFRLGSKNEIRSQAQYAGIVNTSELEREWDKNKSVCVPNCGFKELYILPFPKDTNRWWQRDYEDSSVEQEIGIHDNATKGQLTIAFKKHMNGKMVNKVILSKFIRQVA